MRKLTLLAVLAGATFLGLALPASAQETSSVPDVRGLTPFTVSTNFMSLPGYFRFHYFLENGTWISRAEAIAQVRAQLNGA